MNVNGRCCLTCKNCIAIPRNNRYEDIDYLCRINSYFIINPAKNVEKTRQYTPGGRELPCRYEASKKSKEEVIHAAV